MQLHIEYSRITNQILHRFHEQFKCFSHKCQCQTPKAYSLFKQSVYNDKFCKYMEGHNTTKVISCWRD